MSSTSERAAEEFIERMGVIAEADGLPRIAGRLMALLVLEGGPFSFTVLAERLQVSRGSISTNTRLLEQFGIIERIARPGDRQDYFQIASDPYVRLLRASVERMSKSRELVARTRARLPKQQAGAHKRLKELENFYRATIEGLSAAAHSYALEPVA
jgi:DNA-binding transcriptional regulator GbsR (MarR family)